MTIKDAILSSIRSDTFDLESLIGRIDFFYAKGEISDFDREMLITSARSRATEALGINVKVEIQQIIKRLVSIEARLDALEAQPDDENGQTEGIPEFVQPTGAHDAYYIGDRITFNGAVYECLIDACVWSPEVYPAAWQRVEEGEE